MAIDHALLESAQLHGSAALRLYRWQPACLSFGRNQHTRDIYDPADLAAAGIQAVRRPTGGLAVLHDQELTYSVLAPAADLGGPRAAYRRINEALLAGMRALGVPALLATEGPSRDPRADAREPCFQAPAAGEVMAAGRKLIGSAQRCERGALLQHGSILLDGSQAPVRTLLHQSRVSGTSCYTMVGGDVGAVTVRELLGGIPDWAALRDAIVSGFATVFGTRFAPSALTRDEAIRADQLTAHYSDAAWTWRR